jgi:hypothetical protein
MVRAGGGGASDQAGSLGHTISQVPYFADIMIYMVHTLRFRDAVCRVSKVFLHTLLPCTKHENNSM